MERRGNVLWTAIVELLNVFLFCETSSLSHAATNSTYHAVWLPRRIERALNMRSHILLLLLIFLSLLLLATLSQRTAKCYCPPMHARPIKLRESARARCRNAFNNSELNPRSLSEGENGKTGHPIRPICMHSDSFRATYGLSGKFLLNVRSGSTGKLK